MIDKCQLVAKRLISYLDGRFLEEIVYSLTRDQDKFILRGAQSKCTRAIYPFALNRSHNNRLDIRHMYVIYMWTISTSAKNMFSKSLMVFELLDIFVIIDTLAQYF